MRILIVNSFYFPDQVGGAERSIKILADELVRKGHSVGVFATGSVDDWKEEVIDGVQVFRVPTGNISARVPNGLSFLKKPVFHLHNTYTQSAGQQFSAACEKFRPDVIHSNNLAWISVSVWAAAKRLGIPVVHTLRDYALLCANYGFFRNGTSCGPDRCWQCKLLSHNKIAASSTVALVVGNSRYTLDRHLQLGAFPNATPRVIYNGYSAPGRNSPRFHPLRNGRSFVFGSIGTITAHKGSELLIEAFREICRKNPQLDVKLKVAGTGASEYVAHVKALAEGLPVEFVGVIPQDEFFKTVDACVVPSLWPEPLSRVLFESFAYGVPMISSDAGGSAELVHPGSTGWLFPVDNPSALCLAMQDVLDDKVTYEAISSKVLVTAASFHPDRVFAEYLSAFESVAGSGQ